MDNCEKGTRNLQATILWIKLGLLLLGWLFLAGCQDFMSDQPRYDPLQESEIFADQRSARPLIPDTVPRGALLEEDAFYNGSTEAGQFLEENPVAITIELLERGRERYDIYCSPCHGLDGNGRGMIVQRGFTAPQSFHSERLREAPDGYYFDVISNGIGRMYAYGYRIAPADRWAIAAYIRALQLSQHAPEELLPPEDLRRLESNRP